MKPLSKAVRSALKREYPKLTDAMIDRTEAMLSLRTQLEPVRYAKELETLDRKRIELIKSEMPKYEEVIRAWQKRELVERRRSAPVSTTKVTITRRPLPKKTAGRKGVDDRAVRLRTPPPDGAKRK
jgi:hypothetical protein